MSGLFDTFEIGKRGLAVQQSLINTTAHNISNAATEGYSRQRAVAVTTTPQGGGSKFAMCSAGQVGTGATIASIERIRDTFIDTRFRNQNADNSSLDIQSKYLSEVEDITEQSSNTGIQKALSDFYASFSALSADPVNGKTVAVRKAETLATFINDTYTQLETKNNNIQASLNANVNEVNKDLDDINSLNAEIQKVSSIGLTPNDLMDKRDNLLDKLSKEFGVTVTAKKDNTIEVTSNEKISSVGKLIDSEDTTGATGTRFSYYDSATYSGSTLTVKYFKLGDSTKPETVEITGVTDPDALKKQLEQNRVLIADSEGTVKGKELKEATGASNPPATPIQPTAGNPPATVTVTDTSHNSTTITIDSSGKKTTIKTDASAPGKTTTIIDDTTTNVTTTTTTYAGSTKTITKNNTTGATTTTISTDASGINDAMLKIEKGEIGGEQNVQGQIQTNMNDLDILAKSLAYTVNAIQTGSDGITAAPTSLGLNSDLIFVKDGTTSDTDISAKNIKINTALQKDATLLNCNTTSTSGVHDGTRALAISNIQSLNINYTSLIDMTTITSRADFFATNKSGVTFTDTNNSKLNSSSAGTTIFNNYNSALTKLSTNAEKINSGLETSEKQLADFVNQRLEVSGVSQDEEATNLVAYNHAYQANAKVISTINSLLDVVINGLGV